jgi:hypothetical protein
MLIGLLGQKRVGKDTVADYLVEKYNFKKESMATPLKDICKLLFGFNDNQLYGDKKEVTDLEWGVTPRIVLQYLGTDVFRQDINKIMPDINDNFWVKCMKNRLDNNHKLNPADKIVIADIRFQNEVDMIHELGGIVIKITRPNIDNTDLHISEANIDTITLYDILINNNKDYIDLYNTIDQLV